MNKQELAVWNVRSARDRVKFVLASPDFSQVEKNEIVSKVFETLERKVTELTALPKKTAEDEITELFNSMFGQTGSKKGFDFKDIFGK